MKFVTDYKVEDYILDTEWEKLPELIQRRAIVCSIDLMMALLLGSKGKQFDVGVRLAELNCKDGDIPIIGNDRTFNFLGATIAMSHASNSFDIDDGHNMIKGHPGTSFVAGILAASLEKNVTYKEYLTTLVVAYEVTIRWALAEQKHYDYLHSSGTYGAFGTAAGVGRLYGLSKEQLNNTLSIADFHAPLTPVMRSVEYPSMNKDGVPFGALVGAMAIQETLAGSTGYGYLLEAPEFRHLVETLGESYEIMNLYFKPYTCCRWAHQPIKACLDLMEKYEFIAEDVKEITVYTFDSAAKLSKKIPQTTDEAQYNIAYPIAAALVHGDLGYKQVRDEALDNPQVIEMMKRLNFVTDPEIDSLFPEKRMARVDITLNDGTELQSELYDAPGEASDKVDIEWINKKFMRITQPVLSATNQEELFGLLQNNLDIPIRTIVDFVNNLK
ncbi:MmgE/PrpD family protein [Psychrobacillus sp. NPDC093180]|uniref:MmgE/PrpD family protein n=1 Tax=Psychrobacillus sp. NPDC093180 TaxID=3364489 RepID=UPI003825D817